MDGVALLNAVSGLFHVDSGSVQTQLLHHLGSGGGQVSVQQDAGHAQSLAQVVQHALKALLVGLILGQSPGGCLLYTSIIKINATKITPDMYIGKVWQLKAHYGVLIWLLVFLLSFIIGMIVEKKNHC